MIIGVKSEKLEIIKFSENFAKKIMSAFFDSMSGIFRVGFDTGSKTTEKVIGGIKEMFFDKDEE